MKLYEEYLLNEVDTTAAVVAGATAALVGFAGYQIYRTRIKLADKKYKECRLKCDKYQVWSGGYGICLQDCEADYKKRIRKVKEDIRKAKNRNK